MNLPPRGPAPVNPQMEAYVTRIAPAITEAVALILVLQSQRRDPALYTPMVAHVATILAVSRHIFHVDGASKSAMTQIDALLTKMQKVQDMALAVLNPPTD